MIFSRKRDNNEDASAELPRASAEDQAQSTPVADLAAKERERIYADLHDDIGAKLMELVHTAPDEPTRALAREALDDLRDIVSRTKSISGTLLQILGMIQTEAERRLSARGIALIWDQAEEIPDLNLDDAEALQLFRIFRESISNAIRHARASRLRVRSRVIGEDFIADVTDDGPGTDQHDVGGGRGTRNIQTRAESLGGSACWEPGTEGGTKVVLRMPLRLNTR